MTEPLPTRRAAAAVQRALDGRHDATAQPPPPGWHAGERVLQLGTLAVVALAAALVTTDPIPLRMIWSSRLPSASSISRTRTRSAIGPAWRTRAVRSGTRTARHICD
ncbi:hypothetical protein ACIRJR_13940 [Streptomyces sp. NPDC102402]|uniref:hypothetical protein n=1 Tax=Streptomyces sp. NPDC102402 TaxID=3366169 RepID=UPI00381150E5